MNNVYKWFADDPSDVEKNFWPDERYIAQHVPFNEHHFRKGTVFMCEDLITNKERATKRWTTFDVSCNGTASWVLTTTTPNPSKFIGGFDTLNIAHVTRIIKQGDPVLVNDELIAERYVPPVDHHKTLTTRMIESYRNGDSIFDIDKVHDLTFAITERSWCRFAPKPKLSKRRRKVLRKRLKQNLNRMLIPLKVQLKEEVREMNLMMSDMDGV